MASERGGAVGPTASGGLIRSVASIDHRAVVNRVLNAGAGKLPDYVCGIDTDELLGYSTTKHIWIRNRWIGLCYYVMIVLILAWVLGGQLLYRNEHFMKKDVGGLARLWYSHPTVDHCDPVIPGCASNFKNKSDLIYCSDYAGRAEEVQRGYCRYLDRLSLIPSGVTDNKLFIPTAIETITEEWHPNLVRPNKKNNNTPDSLDGQYMAKPGSRCLRGRFLCEQRGGKLHQFYYVADVKSYVVRFSSSYERDYIRGNSLQLPGFVGVCDALSRSKNETRTWTARRLSQTVSRCKESGLRLLPLSCGKGVSCAAMRDFDFLEDSGLNVMGRGLANKVRGVTHGTFSRILNGQTIDGFGNNSSTPVLPIPSGIPEGADVPSPGGTKIWNSLAETELQSMDQSSSGTSFLQMPEVRHRKLRAHSKPQPRPPLEPDFEQHSTGKLEADAATSSNSHIRTARVHHRHGVLATLRQHNAQAPANQSNETNNTNQRNQTNNTNQSNQTNNTNQSNQTNETDQTSENQSQDMFDGLGSLAKARESRTELEQYSDNWGDVFTLGSLLQIAGADLDFDHNLDGWTTRQAGTAIEVLAVYNNLYPFLSTFGYKPVRYHYVVNELLLPYVSRTALSPVQPGDYPRTRTYENRYGVLIHFKVSGSFGFFNPVYLLLMLTAALALTATASTATDLFFLYVSDQRDNFFHLKYEVSPDFSELWRCEKCGYFNSEKSDVCQGIPKFCCPRSTPICGHPKKKAEHDEEEDDDEEYGGGGKDDISEHPERDSNHPGQSSASAAASA